MTNRLAGQSSPYLLQHKDNPVDWYPWGEEAISRARAEGKPIFLSIGYSACHWCHVMEQESFEDPQVAALLNERFIPIKVDREERPDLDQIYMNAVQLMTGQGGWPLSVFLTPELKPFFGGTYFPPRPRQGLPSFVQVLAAVDDVWRNRRHEVDEQSGHVTAQLQALGAIPGQPGGVDEQLLRSAVAALQSAFDRQHGGFGGAPKFPHATDLRLLLRLWRRWPEPELLEMVQVTLDRMAQGGIYDHLGGGFARYAVDRQWLVPHFEKMLYDNALLAHTYLEAYLLTGRPAWRSVACQTLDYLLGYMSDPAGGFHSSEDADSEGEEGKFYLWTPEQIIQVLGRERGERFCDVYGVSEEGNFEDGKSILHLPRSIGQAAAERGWDAAQLEAELAESRKLLLAARDRRVRPGKDDKVLVSWNALAIDALAAAGAGLDEPRYLEAAERAARFILQHLRCRGRLLHSWRQGRAQPGAYLDDYSYLAQALVTLYEATLDERWIDEAVQLGQTMIDHFADSQAAGFFYTADDHEQLITRAKDAIDSSVPSGNATAAVALLRLGKLCGRDDFLRAAEQTIEAARGLMERAPSAAGQMLMAADLLLGPLYQLVLVADPTRQETRQLLTQLRGQFLPHGVFACRADSPSPTHSPHLTPLFAGKHSAGDAPVLYVCENFQCQAPVEGQEAILAAWRRLQRPQ